MSKIDTPKLVTALFTFKGKNNDELCFKKNDIITITQTDDGGWWEGTLNDKTGWFPSNYVKEYRIPDSGHSSVKSSPEKINQDSPAHQRLNRDIVLKDLVDSERANITELQGLINNFLQPLEVVNVLKKEEYKQLIGNLNEVFEIHQRLLKNLEATMVQGPDSRIGNLFLNFAPKLKSIHIIYCTGHPQAVCILDQFRDELNDFMERNGAVSPGILVLTTGLSKPFRRLEKYAAMLQELERHTEKNHPDRGDTQRSVCVYREIAEQCTCTRKQRELALHVLMGGIKGWEGEELNSLGEILNVGPVTLIMGVEKQERYFVLFPMTLLVLSTSSRMSSFVYEGKLPLTSIEVIALEDTEDMKNALEISGPMIERIVVLCINKDERQQWVEYLTHHQATSLLKSPIISHVSYNNHPFTRLARFFAKLVRKKIIYPELMKKLLYLQYIYKPNLSNVKMRKCAVTYKIYPVINSGEYKSSSSPSSSLSSSSSSSASLSNNENNYKNLQVLMEKSQPRLKSSLMLDVRYATKSNDNRDLSDHLIQMPLIGPSTSLGNLETNSSNMHESTFVTYHSLPNTLLSTNNLMSNLRHQPTQNDIFATLPVHQKFDVYDETMNDAYQFKHWCPVIENWKSIVLNRDQEISISSEIIHTGHLPSHLTTITENVLDTNECSGKINTQLLPINASVHSSDSGMADSYHITSSELNYCHRYYPRRRSKYNDRAQMSHSESENDENSFEHQCICSSPFDSTPRQSKQSGQSSSYGKIPQMPPERGSSPGTKGPWSLACLRPAPPIYSFKTNNKSELMDFSRSSRSTNERQFEDDAIILKVIESYCMAINARFTVHSELAKRIKIECKSRLWT
ncbi:hypothetical protein PV327_007320 [Microctonus hyperodae]|uniref:Rho guanine nucleotide exchange factor 7 n=1 Tax=Microctonus hyperodae TaxID=165561 RepID=A0AA39KJI4_MICHY|nr:hypothetical protein PV327_007320 [Microctonus hyperodae]